MANQRICSVDACGKPHHGGGYCKPHYKRWRRHGSPVGGRVSYGVPLEFLRASLKSDDAVKCIDWPFKRSTEGYGQVYIAGRLSQANRVICEMVNGPPPTPFHEAAHGCGNAACVSPWHLRWATHSENEADKLLHGTHSRGRKKTKTPAEARVSV